MKRTKSKFLLSTRNNFTGKAINNLDNASIKELFDGKSSYMHWETKYLQRRFHGDDGKSPTSRDTNDILIQQRFENFCKIHNGDKPLLILDVDNTMLYVRFFSDEMRINDIVTYFGDSHFRNNAKVLKLQKTLDLEIINGQLIDKLGKEHIEISLWIDDNDTLQKYKKGATYDYKPDDLSYNIQCKILKTEVTGCIIEVRNNDVIEEAGEENEYDTIQTQSAQQIEISFVEENEHLCKLEPTLNRPGMLPVDFIYEGFLIRLRPNLDEFLEYTSEDFDIVIFTAATKDIYNGLLKILHEYIKEQLGRDDENDLLLWTDTLFRDDCTLKNEKRIKPYHHKDLTVFGCHLSRTIMIDNSPIVVSGQEPNVILILDFFGKDQADDEFMEIYSLLDTIKDIKGDVRYFLCDIEPSINDDEKLDLSSEESCKQTTTQFMETLKKDYKHNKKRSISISQSKRYSLSADNIPINPLKADPNVPQQIYSVSAKAPKLVKGSSTPMSPKWVDKYNKRKEIIRLKFQKKHKSLLALDVGKLVIKRHSLYSSMSPKIQDSTNFDIRPSFDEDMDDIMNIEILEHQEINDIDTKFDFDNNMDYGDMTDQEEDDDDDDEDYLINPSPIVKPKTKTIQVKFTNMTSLEIREIHAEDNETYDPLSPIKSDTKPLRIEFAILDDDEDEKIVIKPEDNNQSVMYGKYTNNFNDLDDEKINVSNVSNNDIKGNIDSVMEPLLSVDLNDENDINEKELKNVNDKKKKGKNKKSRLEKEMDEDNGFCNDNFIWRLFCAT